MADKLTPGERRVRLDFNPSGNTTVYNFKSDTATLINRCLVERGNDPERQRCMDKAAELYEAAAMWAVKGVTG